MSLLSERAGEWIDSIRIKAVTEELHEGRACIVRKRTAAAGLLTRLANGFFRLAGNPVRVCTRNKEWLEWEVDCFQLLHGKESGGECGRGFLSFARPPDTVVTERLPGTSLARHFLEGSFREEMLPAAALELKRAHQLHSPLLHGPWSHGDANLANFLFDPDAGRCRMIDFEIIPDHRLDATSRQAEDLLVFLQDLAGCIQGQRWLPAARLFLDSYDRPEVIERLRPRLQVPSGIPRLWYWIRANYIPLELLHARLAALCDCI